MCDLKVDDYPINNFTLGVADTAWLRLRGLLGRKISPNFGLLIMPCRSIHTMWMGYSIDVIFINKQYQVTEVYRNLKPWKMASSKQAYCVIELQSGNAEKLNIKVGSIISW